jgi:hypothetical protein
MWDGRNIFDGSWPWRTLHTFAPKQSRHFGAPKTAMIRCVEKFFLEVAAENLGRADAIDLVDGLKEVAAALSDDPK